MIIGIVSDIHAEFHTLHPRKIILPNDLQILIIAGDLATTPELSGKIIHDIRTKTSAIILYVLGNHEYYGHELSIIDYYKKECNKTRNAFLLEKEVFKYKKTRFLGTTLWSNLSNPLDALSAKKGLNDFNLISENGKLMTVEKYTEEFLQNRVWLKEELLKNLKMKTVVITHHSPSFLTTCLEYRGDKLNACFCSDLSNLILDYNPKIWAYGHDHYTNEQKLGKTALISHQIGYSPGNLTVRRVIV
ncbi:MAG TPA: metallophosphoesterase [Candidatus Lokiarchaeia archaeon]